MTLPTNTQVLLARRPIGAPTPADFALREGPVPMPRAGEILVRNRFLSLDPYMRGRMNDGPSYAPPYALGGPVGGATVGTVMESRHAEFQAGDLVVGPGGWQSWSAYDAVEARKLPARMAHPSQALGVLGTTGLAAWYGLLRIGDPRPGETVVVGAAAGAVGSVVGQIAALKGCRVIGVAGGPAKCRHVVDALGFDACLDHRDADLGERLRAAAPDGVDLYFENVGGAVFDAVWPLLTVGARVPICGLISGYNGPKAGAAQDRLPDLALTLLMKRIRLEGFMSGDHVDEMETFTAQVGEWLATGKISAQEDLHEGLGQAPAAFIGMLEGASLGKTIVRVA